jgi:hypothetical protein
MNLATEQNIVTDRNETSSDILNIYRVPSESGYPSIVPASPEREWMNLGTAGWANRCLPLRIANQAGWCILNDAEFEVEWDGKPGMDSLHFRFPSGKGAMAPFNMVGYGIVSWVPPYLFRTPSGINLWVRGPANEPRDGIAPLEGIVETDWLPYTFTINWKITRPGVTIRFRKGDPVCLVSPVRRYEADRLEPVLQNLASDPDMEQAYRTWHERRLRAKAIAGSDGAQGKLAIAEQGQYIRGESDHGRFQEHQTKLRISGVRDIEPSSNASISAPQPALSNREITAKGYNGSVSVGEHDVVIKRNRGLRGLLNRGLSDKTIPLKAVKSIQFQGNVTLTQMGFMRFVLANATPVIDYKAAISDSYTVLFDKDQMDAFRLLHQRVEEWLG